MVSIICACTEWTCESYLFFYLYLSIADSSNSINRAYHSSAVALAVLTPLAFVAPSAVQFPIDLALGFLFPFHSHVALNFVVTDYIPKQSRGLARGLVLAATVIATAGILKLNVSGPGFTETVKSLWRKPTKEEK